jgi:Reverse transcriptase (RNA-dependent DNA polymerase)
MDYIPTSLLLACKPVFSHLICRLATLSFSEGCSPSSFKFASITPLLKKPNLHKSLPANYHAISILNTISKILERLFLTRFQTFVSSSANFNQFQSTYHRHHATETAILSTLNNIFHSSDNGKFTLLVSLDLRAASDTTDHRILINRLETCFSVSATILPWLSSYLIGRQQSVRVSGHSSPFLVCKSGIPQGSVLGPILFKHLYTTSFHHSLFSWNLSATIC